MNVVSQKAYSTIQKLEYFQVLVQKQNSIHVLWFELTSFFSEINSSALEKRRSEGTDDPVIAKYLASIIK